MQLDTVILAAGRGSRLRGVAAPYHKPFMVVNGRALIVQAVTAAQKGVDDGRIIIVAAPDNVVPMIALLRENDAANGRLRFVVQPEPRGPGAAFILGAEVVRTPWTLVLLADNVLEATDVRAVAAAQGDLVIGYDVVRNDVDAARFTRITPDHRIIETSSVDRERERWESDDGYRTWVGPLKVPTAATARMLESVDEDELKLGRHLNHLEIKPTLVPVASYDVGVPETLEDAR